MYYIFIACFIHYVVLKEWTALYQSWVVWKHKTYLKPFGFCLPCTCGQIALWYNLIIRTPIIETLGLTSIVILIFKIIEYAEYRIKER